MPKGQIILKGLFDILELSHKTNKQIRFSSKNKFISSFFGRIQRITKSPFENIWPLSKAKKSSQMGQIGCAILRVAQKDNLNLHFLQIF